MDGVLAQIRARRKVIEVEDDTESQLFRQNSETGSLFRQSSGRSIGSERLKRLHSLRRLSNRSLSFRSDGSANEDRNLSIASGRADGTNVKISKGLREGKSHEEEGKEEEKGEEEESKDAERPPHVNDKVALPAAPNKAETKSLASSAVNPPGASHTAAASERDRRVSSHVSDADIPSPPPTPPSPPGLPSLTRKDPPTLAQRRMPKPPPGLDISAANNAEGDSRATIDRPSPPPTPLEAESKLQRHFSSSSSRRSGFGEAARNDMASITKVDLDRITKELTQLRDDVRQSHTLANDLEMARKETARANEAKHALQTQIEGLRAQLRDSQTALQHERELKNQLQSEVHASRDAVLELKAEIQNARAREETVAHQEKQIAALRDELESARADAKKVLAAVATMVGGRRELLRLTTAAAANGDTHSAQELQGPHAAHTAHAAHAAHTAHAPHAAQGSQEAMQDESFGASVKVLAETTPSCITEKRVDMTDNRYHLENAHSMHAAQQRMHAAQYQAVETEVCWTNDRGRISTGAVSTLHRDFQEAGGAQEGRARQSAQQPGPTGVNVQDYNREHAMHVGARVDHLRNALEHARRRERTQGRLLAQSRRKCAYTYM